MRSAQCTRSSLTPHVAASFVLHSHVTRLSRAVLETDSKSGEDGFPLLWAMQHEAVSGSAAVAVLRPLCQHPGHMHLVASTGAHHDSTVVTKLSEDEAAYLELMRTAVKACGHIVAYDDAKAPPADKEAAAGIGRLLSRMRRMHADLGYPLKAVQLPTSQTPLWVCKEQHWDLYQQPIVSLRYSTLREDRCPHRPREQRVVDELLKFKEFLVRNEPDAAPIKSNEFEEYLHDAKEDKKHCKLCDNGTSDASTEQELGPDSQKPDYAPEGWCKFALKLPPHANMHPSIKEKKKEEGGFETAYRGIALDKVRPILGTGRLAMLGETVLGGTEIGRRAGRSLNSVWRAKASGVPCAACTSSQQCATHDEATYELFDPKVIKISPDIEYCAHREVAKRGKPHKYAMGAAQQRARESGGVHGRQPL